MKTIIIYSDFQDLPKFFVVDGDYSHLNNVVVNNTNNAQLEDELIALLFDEKHQFKHKKCNKFPHYKVFNKEDVEIINVGWAL